MCGFCFGIGMADIRVRGVPDEIHRCLKSRAALAGQSLNAFLLAQLSEIVGDPTVPQLAHQIRAREPYTDASSASLIRTERDRR